MSIERIHRTHAADVFRCILLKLCKRLGRQHAKKMRKADASKADVRAHTAIRRAVYGAVRRGAVRRDAMRPVTVRQQQKLIHLTPHGKKHHIVQYYDPTPHGKKHHTRYTILRIPTYWHFLPTKHDVHPTKNMHSIESHVAHRADNTTATTATATMVTTTTVPNPVGARYRYLFTQTSQQQTSTSHQAGYYNSTTYPCLHVRPHLISSSLPKVGKLQPNALFWSLKPTKRGGLPTSRGLRVILDVRIGA